MKSEVICTWWCYHLLREHKIILPNEHIFLSADTLIDYISSPTDRNPYVVVLCDDFIYSGKHFNSQIRGDTGDRFVLRENDIFYPFIIGYDQLCVTNDFCPFARIRTSTGISEIYDQNNEVIRTGPLISEASKSK